MTRKSVLLVTCLGLVGTGALLAAGGAVQPSETHLGDDAMEGNAMEANKDVVRRYVDRFNAGDVEGLREVFADDALVHGVLGWGKVDDVMPIWKQLVESLAMQLHVEDMAADGDAVAVRYTERGTARAPFFDKPATGKSYELVAMEWFEVRNGKIERRWGARDAASQAKQLGWDVPATKADVE